MLRTQTTFIKTIFNRIILDVTILGVVILNGIISDKTILTPITLVKTISTPTTLTEITLSPIISTRSSTPSVEYPRGIFLHSRMMLPTCRQRCKESWTMSGWCHRSVDNPPRSCRLSTVVESYRHIFTCWSYEAYIRWSRQSEKVNGVHFLL